MINVSVGTNFSLHTLHLLATQHSVATSLRCHVPEALFFAHPQDEGKKSLTNVSNYLPVNKTSYRRGF